MESLRTVRHHTAVDHCSWCQREDSIGSTKETDVPSATSMSTLEVSINSRNSSDLGSSSTSRSTLLHTTFPQRSWIPTSCSPDVSKPPDTALHVPTGQSRILEIRSVSGPNVSLFQPSVLGQVRKSHASRSVSCRFISLQNRTPSSV